MSFFYIFFLFLYLYMAIFALGAMRNEKWAQGKLLCGAHKRTGLTEVLRSANLGSPVQGELAFRLILQAEKTEGLYRRQVIAFTPFSWLPLFIRGAVTPKGFIGVTERILVRIAVALWSANFHYRRTNFPFYYAIFLTLPKFILLNLKIFFKNLLTK